MKYLKMLGLAAVAAAALMAFVGAGSASATVLCTENVAPCPEGKRVTELHLTQVGTSTTENTAGTTTYTTCSGSTTNVNDITTIGGEATGPLKSWTFSGCTPSTPTVITLGSLDVSSTNVVKRTGTVVTIPLFSTTCKYSAPTGNVIGTLTEGAAAHVTINAVPTPDPGNSIFCPSSTRWTATFQITNHTGVWTTS